MRFTRVILLTLLSAALCSMAAKYSTTWAGTSSNQDVTFYAAADAISTGALPATGSAITGSYKLMTKAEAATYLGIDISYAPYAAKSSGQLVVKSDLIVGSFAAYVFWGLTVSSALVPFASSAAACADNPTDAGHQGVTWTHSPIPTIGDRPPNGGGYLLTGWYILTWFDPPTYSYPYPSGIKKVYHIDASGYIDSIVTC